MFKAISSLALAVPSLACGPDYYPTVCLAKEVKDGHVIIYNEEDYEGNWFYVHEKSVGDSRDGITDWSNKA